MKREKRNSAASDTYAVPVFFFFIFIFSFYNRIVALRTPNVRKFVENRKTSFQSRFRNVRISVSCSKEYANTVNSIYSFSRFFSFFYVSFPSFFFFFNLFPCSAGPAVILLSGKSYVKAKINL